MTFHVDDQIRDTSRHGIRGKIIEVRDTCYRIKFQDRYVRYIDKRDAAPANGSMHDKPQYSPEVLRLARMCGLTPEEVIEAME
jgi:hypothetical protein